MIVDIALLPEALTDISSKRLAHVSAVAQRSVVETMRAHGILAFATAEEATELLRFVRQASLLSQAERGKWEELLITMQRQGRFEVLPNPDQRRLAEITVRDQLLPFGQPGQETVLVIGSNQFEALFPGNVDGFETEGMGVSVARGGALSEVTSIGTKRALAIAGQHPKGYNREVLWTELFGAIAHRSKEIVVLDRYLFKEVANRDSGYRRNHQPEHLTWLLTKIAEVAKTGTHVRLIGGFGDRSDVPTTAAEVLQVVLRQSEGSLGKIAEIAVDLVNWADEIQLPHARHVRFGRLGFSIEDGFDRLSSPNLWHEDGITWRYHWGDDSINGMVSRESRVRQARTATHHAWPD